MHTIHYEEWDTDSQSWFPMEHGFSGPDGFIDMMEAAQELSCSSNVRNITTHRN